MANDRVKFGQFLLNSPELSGDEDTTSSTDSRRNSGSGSGTPPHLSVEMSSPWSQLSSPYTKSPWTKQSPFHSYDHRRKANYTPLGSLIREEGHVYSVASSGEFLYTGSDSRSIRVWSKNQLSDSGGFKSGSGLVKAIVVDPSHGKVFTGHQDGKIRVWKSPNSDQQMHKRVGSLPTWKQLLKSSVDPSKFVEVRRHRRVPRVKHFDAISCLCINHEAGLLYSGSWDKTIKVWRLADGRCLESFAAHDDAVNALAVGFGGLLFSGAADGTLKVWRRELHGKSTRHVYIQTLLEQESAITSLATTCSGNDGVEGGEDGLLYCGSSDGLVNFWEWNKQLSYGGVLRGHKLPVLCLSVAGSLVFSGSADNCICVWRREPGGAHVCLAVLTGHVGPVKCLAVEPEGGEYDDGGGDEEDEDRRWIVYSGSLDKSVKIWRVYENARAT
ncbi:hypothetical protein V2J09_016594 [Rumex salicifolius]